MGCHLASGCQYLQCSSGLEAFQNVWLSNPAVFVAKQEVLVIANYVLLHIRVHWVLCIVDLSSSTVYYMDSINKEVHSPLKLLIKTSELWLLMTAVVHVCCFSMDSVLLLLQF
ncbi:hypothetical protein RHMOL_Rhmol01G0173800 [Rhododendron molle]|uniref:Uncharacterized protein n=1 Tax=Rhododendron molle TaxID=49168 RepID=A0ACC0Q3U6_RHOML|nr:hypothetical protein RHMOL_Rhmol01G0173800 [Rhododendron molle]